MMENWKMYFIDLPYIYKIATVLDSCFIDRTHIDGRNYVGNCIKL